MLMVALLLKVNIEELLVQYGKYRYVTVVTSKHRYNLAKIFL